MTGFRGFREGFRGFRDSHHNSELEKPSQDDFYQLFISSDSISFRVSGVTFLGFVHYCGQSPRGRFVIWRQTANERMVAKLKQIKQKLRRRMHAPLDQIGAWLRSVLQGFYQYHAVPGNLRAMNTFRHRLCRLWRNTMRHRSQRHKCNWDRLGPLFAHWLPQPRVLHPYPADRFDATHPR